MSTRSCPVYARHASYILVVSDLLAVDYSLMVSSPIFLSGFRSLKLMLNSHWLVRGSARVFNYRIFLWQVLDMVRFARIWCGHFSLIPFICWRTTPFHSSLLLFNCIDVGLLQGKGMFFFVFFYFWFLVLVYVCWSFLKTLRMFVPTGSYRSPSFLTTSLVLLSVYKLPGGLRQSKLSLCIIIFPFISYRIKRWTVSYRVMIHFGTMILWGDWYWSNSSSLRLFVNVQTPVHVFPFHQYPSI